MSIGLPSPRLPALALLLAALAGCSSGVQKVTVEGTVTYKGVPLESGILKFVGPEGAYSAAAIQPGGKYIMTDVVPGEVRVGVMEAPQGSGSSAGGKAAAPRAAAVSLPERFREPATSGLVYTVTPDTRDLPIEIR